MSKLTSITCPRCRLCSLLPDSDLSRPNTVIHCVIFGRRQINLHGCTAADPHIYYHDPRRKYKHGRNSATAPSGNKLRYSGEVEKAFLRAHYSSATWPQLCRALGRNRRTIVRMAKRFGLVRLDDHGRRVEAAHRVKMQSQASGKIFNAAQAAYIEACFKRGYWPRAGGCAGGTFQAEQAAIRAAIVAEVAALDEHGRVWSWLSIRGHRNWRSPSVQRNLAEHARQRREYRKA